MPCKMRCFEKILCFLLKMFSLLDRIVFCGAHWVGSYVYVIKCKKEAVKIQVIS